jgi:hypothetical protein
LAATRYYAEIENGSGDTFFWEFWQGGVSPRQFTVKDYTTLAAVDITGWTSFRFVAKYRAGDADAAAVLNETLAGGGIVKTTAASGLLTITFASLDSSSLAYEEHILDAELHGVDASANLWKLAEGVVKIKPGAARTNP